MFFFRDGIFMFCNLHWTLSLKCKKAFATNLGCVFSWAGPELVLLRTWEGQQKFPHDVTIGGIAVVTIGTARFASISIFCIDPIFVVCNHRWKVGSVGCVILILLWIPLSYVYFYSFLCKNFFESLNQCIDIRHLYIYIWIKAKAVWIKFVSSPNLLSIIK